MPISVRVQAPSTKKVIVQMQKNNNSQGNTLSYGNSTIKSPPKNDGETICKVPKNVKVKAQKGWKIIQR